MPIILKNANFVLLVYIMHNISISRDCARMALGAFCFCPAVMVLASLENKPFFASIVLNNNTLRKFEKNRKTENQNGSNGLGFYAKFFSLSLKPRFVT